MKTILKTSFLFLCILLICTCQKSSNRSYFCTLHLDQTLSSINQESFTYDSIVFVKYGNDSIIMEKCSNGKCFHLTFFNLNGDFFENRYRSNDIGDFLGMDSILTFSKKDTAFNYKSAYDFIAIVQSYAYADCQYSIRKVDNDYI